MSELSERLRVARDRTGLKQTQAAKKVGISNKTLSGYENDVSSPDYETLNKLASLYGVTTDYLLGRQNVVADPRPAYNGERMGRAPDQNPIGIELSEEEVEYLEKLRREPDTRLMFHNWDKMSPEERKTFLDLMMMYGNKK